MDLTPAEEILLLIVLAPFLVEVGLALFVPIFFLVAPLQGVILGALIIGVHDA